MSTGNYEKVKEAVTLGEFAEAHLTRAPRGNKYVCPVCNSGGRGTGSSDAAFSVKGEKWKCFACGAGGDVFDLAGAISGTQDKREQLEIVAGWAGVPLERRREATAIAPPGAAVSATATRKREKGTDTPKQDYTAGRERHRRYIAECARRMAEQPDERVDAYLSARGISHDEAVALGIGYDPKPARGWQDEGGAWHSGARLVLPWLGCDYYHIDRAVDDGARSLKYDKPPSAPTDKTPIGECVGAQPIYNPQAFDQDYIIVVEGVVDAIAIQLCGYNAVALAGIGANDFATEAAARNYGGVVIDMLDADERGEQAGATLAELMGQSGVTCLTRAEYGMGAGDTYGGHKDAGEWLAADRADLADMLGAMAGAARDKLRREKETSYREALRHLNVKDPARVALDVLELRDVYEPVPTGIASLDDVLGGGVSLGETTFFGAVSSYGKTTLAVQIADHMAGEGQPVLFVTIEQSAKEIVAKSLSRLVYTENATGWNVLTPQEITSLRTRRGWNQDRAGVLSRAVETYQRMIAPNMRILEGNKQPNVNDIRAIATVMKEHDGRTPVVFIDYLQLLAPVSDRYDTDKRNADMNVSELRKLARDLKTHVWCISSLNRSSYSGVISLDSFKESGGIEYGADNLLGLQPRDLAGQLEGEPDSKLKRKADKIIRENKSKTERDCELVVLKQRNGALPDEPLPLTFKPMSAYFTEPGSAAHQAQARPRPRL